MQLIPILEVRHGKAVHTELKNTFSKKVVGIEPLESVSQWVLAGITSIHLVDVDAIECGEPVNVDLISSIKSQFPLLNIQVSGGINSVDSAFITVDVGADWLVLNGRTLSRKRLLTDICLEFGDKLVGEIDIREGVVGASLDNHIEKQIAFSKATEEYAEQGLKRLIATDIPVSGHVDYQNLLAVNQQSFNAELPIIANGGINSQTDMEFVIENPLNNLSGILLGKVIYEKSFNLEFAVKALSRKQLAS